MKKFNEYLDENLALELKREPKSAAAQQARKMGLTYAGFGRYLDRDGNVAYVVEKGKLIPYARYSDAEDLYGKAEDEEEKEYFTKSKKKAVGKKTQEQPKSKLLTKKAHDTYKRAEKIERDNEKRYSKIESESWKKNNELMRAFGSYLRQVARERPDIEDAIRDYTAEAYEEINRYLYKGHDEGTNVTKNSQVIKYIEAIDEFIDGAESPVDYTVYTGLSERYSSINLRAGDNYLFRGYVSASLSPQVAHDTFAGGHRTGKEKIILQIEIQTGQKAVHIDEWSENGTEMETLLPRGSIIRILSGPHKMKSSIISSYGVGDTMEDDTDTLLYHCVLVQDEDE